MPNEYEIEIVDFNTIDGGLEVFARAWKNGVQLGFGKDGTIDIERFRIFNPPILVDDPLGDINSDYLNPISNEPIVHRLREDPEEAIKQELTHTISNVGMVGTTIIEGSRGNTTDTFYSSAGSVSPRDTWYQHGGGGYTVWSVVRDGTTSLDAMDSLASNVTVRATKDGSNRITICRSLFMFDTSTISDSDSIDSATFSLVAAGYIANNASESIIVVETTHSNTSTGSTADWDIATYWGDTSFGSKTYAAWVSTDTTRNDFTLNASGLAAITKTGVTKLGTLSSGDFNNVNPLSDNYVGAYFADQTGTTNDPKLVVVHSAAATNTGRFFALM